MIMKEICEHIELCFGKDIKVLFITDAGSEYLNNRSLRGIEVTDLDTTRMVTYMRGK